MATATKTTKIPSAAKAPKHAFARTLKTFKTASGKAGKFYSIPALGKELGVDVSRLPAESSWWRLQTAKGHLVLAVLLPIISGASLTSYRRQMIDALEQILARTDQPSQTLGVDFYPVRNAADYAALQQRMQLL